MEQSLLYLLAKVIAMIASVTILKPADADMTFVIISALSLACIFALELLLESFKKGKRAITITNGITIIACFALGIGSYFPLMFVSLIYLLDILVESSLFYYIVSTILLLAILILMPQASAIIVVLFLLAMLLFGRALIAKLKLYQEQNDRQKEHILELNQKLNDIKCLNKTLKYTVSLEERNRIAARIHDQLGHGISGSIIMLEATSMIMKDNPEKANANIQKVITNLREGVDNIRASLRDERVGHNLIGFNDITAMLEEFKVSYNKATHLHTTGDLDLISIEVWACIHDNVQECLTNVLKHSNATEFTLRIEVFKKIVKVEYKDNGHSAESFEKGLGLEAMEERTVNAGGRCFFNIGEQGFCVTNIFTY